MKETSAGSGRILGIDLGEKRIGIALSDPTAKIAFGKTTILAKTPKKDLSRIVDLVNENSVVGIVIGMPITLKGEMGQAAQRVKKFVAGLKTITSVPIYQIDERFTTVLAHQAMHAMGQRPSRNKEKVDQMAATILLQSFLDQAPKNRQEIL